MKDKILNLKYTIYNIDGSIRKRGVITKAWKGLMRRKEYLKNLYCSLVVFG